MQSCQDPAQLANLIVTQATKMHLVTSAFEPHERHVSSLTECSNLIFIYLKMLRDVSPEIAHLASLVETLLKTRSLDAEFRRVQDAFDFNLGISPKLLGHIESWSGKTRALLDIAKHLVVEVCAMSYRCKCREQSRNSMDGFRIDDTNFAEAWSHLHGFAGLILEMSETITLSRGDIELVIPVITEWLAKAEKLYVCLFRLFEYCQSSKQPRINNEEFRFESIINKVEHLIVLLLRIYVSRFMQPEMQIALHSSLRELFMLLQEPKRALKDYSWTFGRLGAAPRVLPYDPCHDDVDFMRNREAEHSGEAQSMTAGNKATGNFATEITTSEKNFLDGALRLARKMSSYRSDIRVVDSVSATECVSRIKSLRDVIDSGDKSMILLPIKQNALWVLILLVNLPKSRSVLLLFNPKEHYNMDDTMRSLAMQVRQAYRKQVSWLKVKAPQQIEDTPDCELFVIEYAFLLIGWYDAVVKRDYLRLPWEKSWVDPHQFLQFLHCINAASASQGEFAATGCLLFAPTALASLGSNHTTTFFPQ